MSSSWIREADYVEKKFLEQLETQGWKTLVIADKENKLRTHCHPYLFCAFLLAVKIGPI